MRNIKKIVRLPSLSLAIERADERSKVGVSQRSAFIWALPAARAIRSYCTGLSHIGRYPLLSLTQIFFIYSSYSLSIFRWMIAGL